MVWLCKWSLVFKHRICIFNYILLVLAGWFWRRKGYRYIYSNEKACFVSLGHLWQLPGRCPIPGIKLFILASYYFCNEHKPLHIVTLITLIYVYVCVWIYVCIAIHMCTYMKHKIVDFHMTYSNTHSIIYYSFKLHFFLYPPISFPTWPFLQLFRFPLHIFWKTIAIALDCQSGLHANKTLTIDPNMESKWLWSAQPQIGHLYYTTSPRPKDHHGGGGITNVIGLKRLE